MSELPADTPLSELLDDSVMLILTKAPSDDEQLFKFGLRAIPGRPTTSTQEEFSTLIGIAYGMMQLANEDIDFLLEKGAEYFEKNKAHLVSEMGDSFTQEELDLFNMDTEGEG